MPSLWQTQISKSGIIWHLYPGGLCERHKSKWKCDRHEESLQYHCVQSSMATNSRPSPQQHYQQQKQHVFPTGASESWQVVGAGGHFLLLQRPKSASPRIKTNPLESRDTDMVKSKASLTSSTSLLPKQTQDCAAMHTRLAFGLEICLVLQMLLGIEWAQEFAKEETWQGTFGPAVLALKDAVKTVEWVCGLLKDSVPKRRMRCVQHYLSKYPFINRLISGMPSEGAQNLSYHCLVPCA